MGLEHPTSPEKSASAFSLFGNRFVQAIMLAGLFMHAGIWIRNFAVLLYVTDMTNKDPFAISLVSVAEFAPIFVFSFIGGTFADRWRPKLTMIWCDLLSAVSVFAVLLAIVIGSWQAVFFTTFVSAILSQFSQPSTLKLFKHHVPEDMMQAGMSIFQTMGALFMVLGPGLGTLIFQGYGIQISLIITGICFVLSALALTRLPADIVDQEAKSKGSTVKQELAAGFRYVMNSKILKALGGSFAFAGLAVGLIQPMGILLVTERLQLDKSYLSVLIMANGIAMLVGGAIAMMVSKKLKPQFMLAIGMAASSIGVFVAGLSTELWLTIAAQAFSGLALPSLQIGINTMILKNSDSAFIGRVNGILNPLFMGSMVITMSLAGLIMQASSIVAIYEIAAILFFIGVLTTIPLLKMRSQEASVQASQLAKAE